MRRASGLDAQLLYSEKTTTPIHTLKIASANPERLEEIREGISASLHSLPPFHWQVLPTPFGLHHPTWIE